VSETWAYLDPKARQRNKLVKIGEGAAWYWACGLMYCRDSDHERGRPGFIPDYQAHHLYATKRARAHVKQLVAEGLWLKVDGGYLIDGYGKVYGHEALDPIDEIVEELAAPVLPARSLSEARAKAGQAGGQRAAELRREASKTGLLAKQTGQQNGFASQANHDAESGSSFQVGSRSGSLNPENTKENPLPKDLNRSARGEVCLDEEGSFLKLERREQAKLLIDDAKRFASLLRPHRWPEIIELVAAFAKATGRGRGVSAYDRDGGVRALVALLAAFDLETLLRAIPFAVKSPWWLEEPNRPLACLSVTVIENALGDAAKEAAVMATIARAEAATGLRRISPSSPPPPILLTGGQA
jgi:hypothetical protein